MNYKRYNDRIIVRLDKGEEIIQSLKSICIENHIKSGIITGIGATDKALIGLYDTSKKEYKTKEIKGDHEITSLNGNISMLDNDIILHLHITLGDQDYNVIGGHLYSANVSVTFECIIEIINADIIRIHDSNTGLKLLSFK
ncbi:MAG: DNA-binding protein [Candidatus Thermoplasmatota archaeon]